MVTIGGVEMKQWLSYRGVRDLTSLSESTIRRLVDEGKLPRPEEVTPGRKVFDSEAVGEAMERLIAERRQNSLGASA
jgi:predicted DNA-binding transcriptional regulator AlpA